MKTFIAAFCLLLLMAYTQISYGQTTQISFELNGRSSNQKIEQTAYKTSKNPFAKFVGEWALKNDDWKHNWGGETESIKIPNHHTVSSEINTDNSLLSIIDGPSPNGHIFWSYNPVTKEVEHLSSFGALRAGTGKGTVDAEGNLRLKLSFEGEAKGTYRIYTYTWINHDEYALKSVQFDAADQPTGLFYQGNFVRIKKSADKLKQEVQAILSVLDNHQLSPKEQLEVYAEGVNHMAPNHKLINNKADLLAYLSKQREFGHAEMEHQIIDLNDLGDTVIMQGQVIGRFYPSNGDKPISFSTKNLFIFKRVNGVLKIWKVIYNSSPSE